MKYSGQNWSLAALTASLILALSGQSVRANVYASNIKLNGVLNNASVVQGGTVNISYILNEPANSGVTIKIYSGAAVVRTVNVAGGGTGALRGANTVARNCKDDSNANVPLGTYTITIMAASTGHSAWDQISNDSDAG